MCVFGKQDLGLKSCTATKLKNQARVANQGRTAQHHILADSSCRQLLKLHLNWKVRPCAVGAVVMLGPVDGVCMQHSKHEHCTHSLSIAGKGRYNKSVLDNLFCGTRERREWMSLKVAPRYLAF